MSDPKPRYTKRQPAVKAVTQKPQRDTYRFGKPQTMKPSLSNPAWRMLARLSEVKEWTPTDQMRGIFLDLVSKAQTGLERGILLGLGCELFGLDVLEATEIVEIGMLERAHGLDGGRT